MYGSTLCSLWPQNSQHWERNVTCFCERYNSHVEIPYYDNTKMFSIPCFLNKCFTCKNVHAFHTASQPSAVCTDSKTNSATQSQVRIEGKCIHVHYFKRTEQALWSNQMNEYDVNQPVFTGFHRLDCKTHHWETILIRTERTSVPLSQYT